MRTKIIIAVVALVALVAIYFLFFRKKRGGHMAAKVGTQHVSGSPSNSITNLAIQGIKALTSSPTNKGASQVEKDSGEDDSGASSDDDE